MIGVSYRPVGPSLGNLGLATELHDLAEDIVGEDETTGSTSLDQTIIDPMSTVVVMKSEPTQKVFTQTRSMIEIRNFQIYTYSLIMVFNQFFQSVTYVVFSKCYYYSVL